jgi:uncharacterized protein YndB with AHSA1/START domain
MPDHLTRAARFCLFCLLASACTSLAQKKLESPSFGDPMPQSIRISWEFSASPAEVWAAWTQPELVREWFGSNPDGKVLRADLDVRPKGGFEVTFADPDGTQHTASGRYTIVEPNRLLRFTWAWKSEPGIQTIVTVALAAQGSGTRMEFEHGELVHASSHDYARGWRSTFEKIERVLERRKLERHDL